MTASPHAPTRPTSTPITVAHDEQDRPSERGGGEAEPPPAPENEAEQDQSWDHGEFLRLVQHTVRPLGTSGGTKDMASEGTPRPGRSLARRSGLWRPPFGRQRGTRVRCRRERLLSHGDGLSI